MTFGTKEQNVEARRLNWKDPVYREKQRLAHLSKPVRPSLTRSASIKESWENSDRRARNRKAMTGRRFINNGVEQRLLKVGEKLPVGWVFGMCSVGFGSGTKWVTNGTRNLRIAIALPIPDGWRLGATQRHISKV